MVQGGAGPRPQQTPQQQQYQSQRPAYRDGPTYRQDTFINSSTRISDIRPEKTESEDFCRKQLTSYEVFTVLPGGDDDSAKVAKDKKKETRSSWGSKDKEKDGKTPKKRERWAKVQINQESFPREEIVKAIKRLDAGRSVTEKKAKLYPNQSTQVTRILDDKIMAEREPQLFEWVLAQLHREEATNPNTGRKETTSMTLYLKRAPLAAVDTIALYRARQERARMAAQRQAQIFQQQQAHAQAQAHAQQQQFMAKQGVYQQQPGGMGPRPAQQQQRAHAPVQIVQDGVRKVPSKGGKPVGIQIAGAKVKAYHSDASTTSSDSGSDSDSDSDRIYDSDTTPTSAGSERNGRRKTSYHRDRRARSRSRSRSHHRHRNRSEDFVVIERPRRRSSTSYVPDPPRAGGSRVHTYNRVGPSPSPSVVNPPQQLQQLHAGFEEMVALGVAALTRAAAAGMPTAMSPQMGYAPPAPRMLTNMERGAHEDLRAREEQRRLEAEERMQQDKVQDAVQEAVREEMARREAVAREAAARRDEVAREVARREAAVKEGAAARERENAGRERGRERERDAFGPAPRRFAEDELLEQYRERGRELFAPSVSSASSGSGSMAREREREWPRRRGEYGYARRGVPLDDERGFEYVRDPNPFRPLPTRERRGDYDYRY